MEPRSIAAIEISSSKIKGGVATVDAAGVLTVLAIEEIKASNNVRYGRVQNVQEVSSAVNEVIRKLENNPAVAPGKIVGVVIPVGGRSLASIPASGTLNFPGDMEIMADTVSRLKQEALRNVITSKYVETVLPRTFYVNNVAVGKPVGNYGQTFRGDFVLIAISPESRRNLERVKFESITPDRVFPRLRATAVADLVVTESERELGCALVDFGAETVTISVYKDKALCYLATLPLGSRTITRDLMNGLSLTEDRAEEFKINIGDAALPETGVSAGDPTAVEINNFVQARAGEIAANIVHQILQSGFKGQELASGIILTGGGSLLRNFDNVLAAQSKMPVRKAAIPPVVEFRSNFDRTPENIDIVALLWAGARSPKVVDCIFTPPHSTIVFSTPEEEPEPETPAARHTEPETPRHRPEPAVEPRVEPVVSRPAYRDPEPADDEPEPEEKPRKKAAAKKERKGLFGGLFSSDKSRRRNSNDVLSDDPDEPEEIDEPEDTYEEEVEEIPESYYDPADDEIEDPDPNPAPTGDPFDDEQETPRSKGGNPLKALSEKFEKMTQDIGNFFSMPDEPDDNNYDPPMK